MSAHLNDEQWTALALEESDPGTIAHVKMCAECRAEVEGFEAALGAFG